MRGEPSCLAVHELFSVAAAASFDGDEDSQAAEGEQPAARVCRPSAHDEPMSIHDLFEESDGELPAERSRGVSIKKRKRSRKPGSQRHKNAV